MNTTSSIRQLDINDAEAYRAFMLEAYQQHPDAFTSSFAERVELPVSWWQTRLGQATAHQENVIGAFDTKQLIGVLGIRYEHREKIRHKAHIFGMYVAASHRRQGIALQLLATAIEQAKHHAHIKLLQLTVTAGNQAAQQLYQHCGFIPYGQEPMAIAVGEQFLNKIHMWLPLEQ